MFTYYFSVLRYEYTAQQYKQRFWQYEWLKNIDGGGDGLLDILFTLDLFFVMIIMCPGEDSSKFRYDPIMEFDCYDREREANDQTVYMESGGSIEMKNIN